VINLWNIDSGLAHICGVIWRAVPTKFKIGMYEIQIFGSEICSIFCDIGLE
jgi:hypothetical protein